MLKEEGRRSNLHPSVVPFWSEKDPGRGREEKGINLGGRGKKRGEGKRKKIRMCRCSYPPLNSFLLTF